MEAVLKVGVGLHFVASWSILFEKLLFCAISSICVTKRNF